MDSLLVRLVGFPALLIHGDTLVLDRWRWLSPRLPITGRQLRVLDVGCGNGAFTIGAARRGYRALGVTISAQDARKAAKRAALCETRRVCFDAVDARVLDERGDFAEAFDVVLCTEVIEHILDDRKLMRSIARCLVPGGRLLLTTPNFDFRPMTASDLAPPSTYEDGGHVRRGYTEQSLRELCRDAGLDVDDIGFCGGVLSQKVTALLRMLSRHIHPVVGWLGTLGLRSLPMLLDPPLTRLLCWPGYSIYLEAHRPDVRSG